jgi:hypothetical protein
MRYYLTLTSVLLVAAAASAEGKWGTIKGQVVYNGAKRPGLVKIDVNKDKNHCLSKGPLYDETWTVDKKGLGVRWVIVWLKPEPGAAAKLPVNPALAKATAGQKHVIDQPCCQFEPHCLTMQDGQRLVIKNSAPVAHNSNVGGLVNPLISPGGEFKVANGVLVAKKTPYTVNCNIHPWMKAWVLVLDHPYATVTDKYGKFEIKDAPAGKYRLVVWHEDIGYLGGAKGRDGMKINIKANGVTDVGRLKIKPDTEEKK